MNPTNFSNSSNSTTIGNIGPAVHEAPRRTYAENELIRLLSGSAGTYDFARMNFSDLIDAAFSMYRMKDEEKGEEWRNRIDTGRSTLRAILEHPDTAAGQVDLINALDSKLALSRGLQDMKRAPAAVLTDLFPAARHIKFIGERTVNFRDDEWKNLTPSTLEPYLDARHKDIVGIAIHRAINRCNDANDIHFILDAIKRHGEHLTPKEEAMLFNKIYRRFHKEFDPDAQTMNDLLKKCLTSPEAEAQLRKSIMESMMKYFDDGSKVDFVAHEMVPQMFKAWNSGERTACDDFYELASNPDIDLETRLVLNLAALFRVDLINPLSETEQKQSLPQRFFNNLHNVIEELASHPEILTKYKPFIIKCATQPPASVDDFDYDFYEMENYPAEILRKILDSTPVNLEDLQRLFNILHDIFKSGSTKENVEKLFNEAETVGVTAGRMAYLYEHCEGSGRAHAFAIATKHKEGLLALVDPNVARERFPYYDECITLLCAALKEDDLSLRKMILDHIERTTEDRPAEDDDEEEIAAQMLEILESRSIIESGRITLEGDDTKEFLGKTLEAIGIHKRMEGALAPRTQVEQLDNIFDTAMQYDFRIPELDADVAGEETLNIGPSGPWVLFDDLKGFEHTDFLASNNQGMEKPLNRKRERDEGESPSEAPSIKRPRIESQDSASSHS